jgi:hypothetical protein
LEAPRFTGSFWDSMTFFKFTLFPVGLPALLLFMTFSFSPYGVLISSRR